MYEGLDPNKATTILAALATAFCFTLILFLGYGERLREKSSFARYSREAEKKMSVSPSTDVSANVGVKESESDDKLVEGDLERGDGNALAEHLAERGMARGQVPGEEGE